MGMTAGGYQVSVLDNLSNSSEKSLQRVEAITGRKVPFYKAEVTQQNHVPFRVGMLDIRQDLLQHGLRPAVGVSAGRRYRRVLCGRIAGEEGAGLGG